MNIRLATIEDARDILDWRNDPLTMKMSFSDGEIKLKEHTDWLDSMLQNDDVLLFITEIDDTKAAMTRFDRNKNSLEVSININPKFRGNGLASPILDQSIKTMQQYWGTQTLSAKIKNENYASIKLFQKLGFALKSSQSDMVIYEKSKNNE